MSIRVKLFGLLADVVGKSEIHFQNVNDTNSLKEKIISDFPDMKKHSFVLAVCKQIIKGNHFLKNGDEVVLLPPFAGG